jgi:hypothetical protein
MPKLEARWIRATGIRATGIRATWGHLRCAHMATTNITPMHAHLTGTMDQAGSRAESLLASGRGAVAIVASTGDVALAAVAIVASTGDVALAAGATTETGRPFPGAEHFAVGSVTVTPVEADVPSVEADVASAEADVASVEADVASAEADVAPVEADVAPVEADMPPVEADVASVEADMPPVEAEAEAVPMVVGAGRLHPQFEALAADGICWGPGSGCCGPGGVGAGGWGQFGILNCLLPPP